MDMTRIAMPSSKLIRKTVGVGLVTGGLMLGLPAAMASAGPLSDVVNGVNDGVQNVVNGNNANLQDATNYYNSGLQGSTAYNNTGVQANVGAANSAAQSTVSKVNGLVKFAVQGLLR
jgi:hypothetical protein